MTLQCLSDRLKKLLVGLRFNFYYDGLNDLDFVVSTLIICNSPNTKLTIQGGNLIDKVSLIVCQQDICNFLT